MGAPEPTTYLPYAGTIYGEGLHFPCIRIQENGKDKADLIRMGHQKIRVSNIWYGDYRAQVGACRTGERRLKELIRQYGVATIKAFIEAWMDYGKRRAIAAIRQLPSGSFSYQVSHDPVPGVADRGIPIKATVTIDPEGGLITVDVRDNPDCVPGGLNLSEACAVASCRIGVFYNIDPSIPHNHGSASRIVPLLRDGCVVGRPKHPIGTSCATSNCNERLANAVQCCFSEIGEPYGMAEGGGNFSAALGVVSGTDARRAQPVEYITQLMLALSGGPGSYGHDGWLTYECSVGNGIMVSRLNRSRRGHVPDPDRGAADRDRQHGLRPMERRPGDGRLLPVADRRHGRLRMSATAAPSPPRACWAAGRALPAAAGSAHANGEIERLPDFHQEKVAHSEAIALSQLRRRRLRRSAEARSRASCQRRQSAVAQPRAGRSRLRRRPDTDRQWHRLCRRRSSHRAAPGATAPVRSACVSGANNRKEAGETDRPSNSRENDMRVEKRAGIAVAAGAAAVIAAGLGAVRADDPIIIGAAIAQSGVVAPYDEGPAKAMEIAIEEINAKGGVLGRPLKIIYADTKSDIAYGATAAQEVIDQGATMVVVTCDYDFGGAAASVAELAQPDRLLDLRRRSEVRPFRHRSQCLHHGDGRARPGDRASPNGRMA